jgi:alpha-tubulin suppressor-like RCC1 family protein
MSIPGFSGRPVRLVVLVSVGLVGLGCGPDTESPVGPSVLPSTATATTTLVFRQISAGWVHSCGVTTDNRAYCWGSDSTGQLGDKATTNRGRPTLVAGGLSWREVYAGGAHTCGITTTNRAYCWGENTSGQLGDGTTTERHQPVPVANGAFVQIRAGYRHTCAVNASNVAFCWGDNTWGQLGDDSKTRRLKPARVAGGIPLLWVTTGAMHSCGIGTDRRGYCWGKNGHGELGDGTTATRLRPTAVMGARKWRQIWAGTTLLPKFTQSHTCGITTDKRAFCWGDDTYGQLGAGIIPRSLVPVAVSGGLTFSSISAGLAHSCATTTSDLWSTAARTYCWGSAANGQLGNGSNSTTPFYTPSPVIPAGLPLTWVAAGELHTCALTGAGQAYCWGADGSGQLGNAGASTSSTTPVAVVGP